MKTVIMFVLMAICINANSQKISFKTNKLAYGCEQDSCYQKVINYEANIVYTGRDYLYITHTDSSDNFSIKMVTDKHYIFFKEKYLVVLKDGMKYTYYWQENNSNPKGAIKKTKVSWCIFKQEGINQPPPFGLIN